MRATEHKRETCIAFRWRLLNGLCLNTYFSTKLKTNYILNMYVWFVYMQPLYVESTTTCMCRHTACENESGCFHTVVLPSTRARVLNYSLQGFQEFFFVVTAASYLHLMLILTRLLPCMDHMLIITVSSIYSESKAKIIGMLLLNLCHQQT
jgi:hypothetical protein